jgi:hypothetical protein
VEEEMVSCFQQMSIAHNIPWINNKSLHEKYKLIFEAWYMCGNAKQKLLALFFKINDILETGLTSLSKL